MEHSRVALLIRIRRSLKARLVQLAEREHRSLNQQIEFLLEHALANEESNLSEPHGARPQERRKH